MSKRVRDRSMRSQQFLRSVGNSKSLTGGQRPTLRPPKRRPIHSLRVSLGRARLDSGCAQSAARTALRVLLLVSPALTGWANLWRAYGASQEGKETPRQSFKSRLQPRSTKRGRAELAGGACAESNRWTGRRG